MLVVRGALLLLLVAGCGLRDGESCSWVIKLEYENANKVAALEAAKKSCDELKHAGSCWLAFSWADRCVSTRRCQAGPAEFLGSPCTHVLVSSSG